ncbi:Alpha/Beta hydrolase protein [Bombardia bombarda]|uniref:Palmitoyl-protein thioesterase 1 n=1 Tax=Bombardia bombarda TaxID=252184 RepID=A0AA39XMJ4_9PEZI|nr:Alpha/Beta hydrolase protein [Bombardia bombarda]
MAIRNQLKLLFTAGSLITAALANPINQNQKSLADDDDDTPLPLVIWHGLGDNYAAEGLHEVGALAEAVNPGTLVYFIRMDDTASRDQSATFFGNVTEQIAKACADIAAHPILSTAPAIDALGFSQGGQFLRGYVERCNSPPVRSLVTFGSQHNGISAFRECGASDWVCKGAMALLRGNAWSSLAQSRLVPAQYYRDPAQYDKYLEYSNFLADINNERAFKKEKYKENIVKLENLVLYMFEDDTTVVPKETAWFEEVNGTEVTPLRARKMYSEDWIGLRELDRKGGLQFRTAPGEHMRLEEKLLNETFAEFFGPLKLGGKKASRPATLGDGDL